MSKWKKVKLKEIAYIQMGQSPKSEFYNFDNEGVAFLQGNKSFGRRYPMIEMYCNDPKKIAKKGDVLLSVRAPVGEINIASEDVCIGRGLSSINSINGENNFLFYLLLSMKNEIVNKESGTVFGSINKDDLENLEVFIPPPSEQKEIAGILSSLDDKVDLLHRQNKTLEAIAETLFRQWFIEEAEEIWEVSTIGEHIATVLGGTPSTTTLEYWEGDIPWINSGEVNNFRIDKPTRYITKLGLEKSNTKLLPKGTTVVAITGATLGQISFLEINTCANQSIVGIIPNDKFPKEFVFFWIKYILQEILLNETGGAQPHINKNDVNEAQLIIPPSIIMNQKVAILKNYFSEITNNVSQICTLERLRNTLLTKLMSGEVSVKHVK